MEIHQFAIPVKEYGCWCGPLTFGFFIAKSVRRTTEPRAKHVRHPVSPQPPPPPQPPGMWTHGPWPKPPPPTTPPPPPLRCVDFHPPSFACGMETIPPPPPPPQHRPPPGAKGLPALLSATSYDTAARNNVDEIEDEPRRRPKPPPPTAPPSLRALPDSSGVINV